MRYSALAAVVASVALASCALFRTFPPDPHKPGVFVVESQIIVDQDPIVIPKGDRAAIVWHLRGSNLQFPENGITIEKAGDQFRCAREGEQTFVCQNVTTRPGHYKYTIRVLEGGKPLEPLDPFIYVQ
jgi:hypothetical protein